MTRVLLGFGDAMAAPEAVFSMRKAGFEAGLLLRRGSTVPPLARHIPGLSVVEITAPETDAAKAVADLRAARLDGYGVALAMDDVSLWLFDAALRDRPDLLLASAPDSQALFALDKRLQLDAARAAGLAVPATLTGDVAAGDADGFSYPAIAKPALAINVIDGKVSKGKSHYLGDAPEVHRFAQEHTERPYLVQPLISGVAEGVFGFAVPGALHAMSAHRRVRMMNPHGSAASACRSILVDSQLREAVERMILAIGWRGPFMVEMLRDEAGQAWFMEFNGRLWGSTALARRQGFEYPAWAVQQALDPAFVPSGFPGFQPIEMRNLGMDLLHLLFVLRGPKSSFYVKNWPPLRESLAGVLRPTPRRLFYNYDPEFPNFFLHDAVHAVVKFVRRFV
jgi:hypothetical protein